MQVAIELLDPDVSQVRASKSVFGLVRQVATRIWVIVAEVLRGSVRRLLFHHHPGLPRDRSRRPRHPEFKQAIVHNRQPNRPASQPMLQTVVEEAFFRFTMRSD